ncbi:DNA-processing protein DprA [Mycoplasmopsis caviae]|uniref:DNA processing protein n=1 Tax=Mycoplasmopsis caviae TaxID=55603 RepID=A0A3P8KW93_9BACT|nr:DNA-processing protein DprA [Mycoplasmopsis caviae]UUD35615.1 DNA-processing protein DprA [Mycoplasmopsis caviae]VDR41627.1 DNA processing protein [Mycoplasmopsis caviae]
MNPLLVYLSYKFEGNVFEIYKFLKSNKKISQDEIDSVLKELEEKDIKYICALDYNYPESLKQYRYLPHVLFYKGNIELLNKKSVCLTGDIQSPLVDLNIKKSQNAMLENFVLITNDFKNLDQKFVDIYRENKKGIVHILPYGFNYLKETHNLENELYISQYPPHTHAKLFRFKERNILMSMLSEFLIIYSSKNDSGILNLATAFANNNKEVYCYPGLSYDDGNNILIKNGANLITQIAEVQYY